MDKPVATIARFGIDCQDPKVLADFYCALLGWKTIASGEEYAMVEGDGGFPMVFWKIDDTRPPTWPEPGTPKQFHIDLYVEDLDTAQARAIELGATLSDHQPGPFWRVLLDPAGHPFCITNPD